MNLYIGMFCPFWFTNSFPDFVKWVFNLINKLQSSRCQRNYRQIHSKFRKWIPQNWHCATWMKQSVLQQQAPLHIRTVASYFDAKKCLTITWRSTCRQSKRAPWRRPLTPKAALTRRSFFQTPIKNSKMKSCRVILWRKENHLAIGWPAALAIVNALLFFQRHVRKKCVQFIMH